MRASDVDLIEMADATVARSNGDILELNVHVVFSYSTRRSAAFLAVGEG